MEGINYAPRFADLEEIALGIWLGMVVFAISNGYIGNTYVTPQWFINRF